MTQFDLPTRRQDPIRMRNYGRIIQDMVTYAVSLTDTFQRQNMTIFVARCMRQKNATWNKDPESGIERLREDIAVLSDNMLDTSFPEFQATLVKTAGTMPQPNTAKYFKKKKI